MRCAHCGEDYPDPGIRPGFWCDHDRFYFCRRCVGWNLECPLCGQRTSVKQSALVATGILAAAALGLGWLISSLTSLHARSAWGTPKEVILLLTGPILVAVPLCVAGFTLRSMRAQLRAHNSRITSRLSGWRPLEVGPVGDKPTVWYENASLENWQATRLIAALVSLGFAAFFYAVFFSPIPFDTTVATDTLLAAPFVGLVAGVVLVQAIVNLQNPPVRWGFTLAGLYIQYRQTPPPHARSFISWRDMTHARVLRRRSPYYVRISTRLGSQFYWGAPQEFVDALRHGLETKGRRSDWTPLPPA